MTELVIWAQSICRSTMSLYREAKRQANVPVTVVVRQSVHGRCARQLRERQGQGADEFADVVDVEWDGGLETGRSILVSHVGEGVVHVFSGYQVCAVVRELIREAHAKGCRVAEYDEAPCEMCLGVKAWLKRLYYRWWLPRKVGGVTRTADVFLNACGRMGTERLLRLGWTKEKVVPFGYASEGTENRERRAPHEGCLRILHTGEEKTYRGVETLERAVEILRQRGIEVSLERTAGRVPAAEMPRLYGWADVFVACGLCEPWGMRVNDAIHAGLPVIVSSGMGVEWLVAQSGCGCVYEKGMPWDLAKCLERFATDGNFRRKLRMGVSAAHAAWLPEVRAKVLMDILRRCR